MKNQNFLGQTPRQSDNLTKGSISRLQGLNRKKERYDKNIQKVSSTKRIGKNEDPGMNERLERSVQTKINLVVRKFWKIRIIKSEWPQKSLFLHENW